jgi:hypothetical protein
MVYPVSACNDVIEFGIWSGRADLNCRPLAPQAARKGQSRSKYTPFGFSGCAIKPIDESPITAQKNGTFHSLSLYIPRVERVTTFRRKHYGFFHHRRITAQGCKSRGPCLPPPVRRLRQIRNESVQFSTSQSGYIGSVRPFVLVVGVTAILRWHTIASLIKRVGRPRPSWDRNNDSVP